MTGELSGGLLEVKFRLPPGSVPTVLDWIRRDLRPDPHGTGEFLDAYRVQSVYLDTPMFDVFHRRGSFARAKYRIRRYGDSDVIYLERKLKRDGRVRKRRVPVGAGDLERLQLKANGALWRGAWFHHRVALRGLQPVVMMDYWRVARRGMDGEGEFRITLDRELHARPLSRLHLPMPLDGADLLGGGAMLEVKFMDSLPAAVKQIVEAHQLPAGGFSKYRTGVASCGLVAVPAAEAVDSTGKESC